MSHDNEDTPQEQREDGQVAGRASSEAPLVPPPPPHEPAALSREEQIALLRRSVEEWNAWRKANPHIEPNLQRADLRQAYLRNADLRKADLRAADLHEAYLRGSSLEAAVLFAGHLEGADLRGADLQAADLKKCELRRVELTEANLRKADLSGADLQNADLMRAKLVEANLRSTELALANLQEADLSNADLSHADLTGARLRDAKLPGADLSEAILTEADLTRTDLTGASIRTARFIRSDMTDAVVEDVWVQDVQVSDLTGLPRPPRTLKVGHCEEDMTVIRGHEAERFFHCPAIVEAFLTERLDNDTMAGFHFHLAEMQKKNAGTDVFLVGHRMEGDGSVLQFQAPTYEAIYEVLPDLLAPFQRSQAINWSGSLAALSDEDRPEAINALVKAQTATPEGAWHFAERLAGFFPQFIKAEIKSVSTPEGRAARLELYTDENALAALNPRPVVNSFGVGRIGDAIGSVEVIAMGDRSIKASGDLVGATTGDRSSVTTGDITIIKGNVDKAAIPEDDLKEALKKALIELDGLDIPDDDKQDAADNIGKLQTELEKPERRPSRLKAIFDCVKAYAPTVAAGIEAAKSWGKIFEGMTD